MTLWKPALGLALALGVTACSPATSSFGDGATTAPVAGRAARVPGVLNEIDIVRAVQSSL